MSHLALRALSALAALLPWGVLRAPGAILGVIVGSAVRWRRAAVDAAIVRAGFARPRAIARAMYRSLGVGFFELLWLAGASASRRAGVARERVIIDEASRRAIADALTRGPVVLAGSHTGNWELAAFAVRVLIGDLTASEHSSGRAVSDLSAPEGRGLAIVAKRQHAGAADAFMGRLRTSFGLELLRPEGAMAAAARALRAGSAVALPIDQVPDKNEHGERVLFLGAPALVDRAPATIACRAGASLLVVAVVRDGATQRVRVVRTILPRERAVASQAWIASATEEATAALDEAVRRSPESWLWLHRRWRESNAPRRRPRAEPSLVATAHSG